MTPQAFDLFFGGAARGLEATGALPDLTADEQDVLGAARLAARAAAAATAAAKTGWVAVLGACLHQQPPLHRSAGCCAVCGFTMHAHRWVAGLSSSPQTRLAGILWLMNAVHGAVV